MSMTTLNYGPDVRPWQQAASCAGTDVNQFVPDIAGKRAPAVCGGCPVKKQCLEFGKATESEGWWGGQYLSPPPEPTDESSWLNSWIDGQSDAQIAELFGVSRQAVQEWRTTTGLPSNLQRKDGHLVNRNGERVCRLGHPRTDKPCSECRLDSTRHAV